MPLQLRSELPVRPVAAPPLLFVHGAWHGAWCWRNFLPFFASHGYEAHALSLRGHGESPANRSLRFLSIGDYVEDVAEVATGLREPPVIVAHSMGGFVTHHYLNRGHRAAGVVFLAAVPPRGAWKATWYAMRRHPLIFARVNLTMSLYPLIATPDRAREFLFSSDLPADLRLQDESYRAYVGMLLKPVLRRRDTTPALVLSAGADALIDESDVRSTARFYGVEPKVFPGMAHDMMLEPRWER